jgi:hypothetical protein
VLDHLARVGHGTASLEEEPLVSVRATRQGTVVRLGDREVSFDDLVTNTGGSHHTGHEPAGEPSDDRREVAA